MLEHNVKMQNLSPKSSFRGLSLNIINVNKNLFFEDSFLVGFLLLSKSLFEHPNIPFNKSYKKCKAWEVQK